MAKLSRDEVLALARLARIELADDEIERFQAEINEILGFVEQLQNVDTKGLEPTYQVNGLKNVTRPDEIVDYGVTPDELLKNVPAVKDHQIKVKRVL